MSAATPAPASTSKCAVESKPATRREESRSETTRESGSRKGAASMLRPWLVARGACGRDDAPVRLDQDSGSTLAASKEHVYLQGRANFRLGQSQSGTA